MSLNVNQAGGRDSRTVGQQALQVDTRKWTVPQRKWCKVCGNCATGRVWLVRVEDAAGPPANFSNNKFERAKGVVAAATAEVEVRAARIHIKLII